MPHPRFKITKGAGDEYTFNLTAANGEKILSSERYTTRASAEAGVAAVKVNAVVDARYEKREAKDGQLYFVLKAANNEIVGVSETYTSSSSCAGGIAAAKVNAPAAGVEG
jgi:uncharacterized protein YegP (UPF0339 family)